MMVMTINSIDAFWEKTCYGGWPAHPRNYHDFDDDQDNDYGESDDGHDDDDDMDDDDGVDN